MFERKHRKAIFILLLIAATVNLNVDSKATGKSSTKVFSPNKNANGITPTSSQHSTSQSSENVSNVSNLVEVYEHEFYDLEQKAWIGGSGPNTTQRWTSSPTNLEDAKILPPPPQLMSPKGYEYTSEWKIDVTGSTRIRDELGWEYFIDKHDEIQAWATGRRRRRWLRSVALSNSTDEAPIDSNQNKNPIPSEIVNLTTSTTMPTSTSTSSYTHRISPSERRILIRNYIHQKVFKEFRDSFNFKGYGLAFRKSMLNREAFGAVLSLPLTMNFDFFETRPWFPLFTTTCGIFYPLKTTISINASLPVALLKYILLSIWDQTKFGFTIIWYLVVKTIMIDIIGILILSNFGKMLGFGTKNKEDHEKIQYNSKGETIANKKFKIFQDCPSAPPKRGVKYSSRISERLGVSITWQCSEDHGLEFKWNWWHCVLPTIEHIGDVSQKIIDPLVKNKSDKLSNDQLVATKEWLRQKVGSCGVVWGGFTPDPPFYTCNAALTLSGFYYTGGESLKKLYSVPARIFVANSKPKQKIVSRIKRSDKKREKKLQDIMTESDDSECEIIDIKISAT